MEKMCNEKENLLMLIYFNVLPSLFMNVFNATAEDENSAYIHSENIQLDREITHSI